MHRCRNAVATCTTWCTGCASQPLSSMSQPIDEHQACMHTFVIHVLSSNLKLLDLPAHELQLEFISAY